MTPKTQRRYKHYSIQRPLGSRPELTIHLQTQFSLGKEHDLEGGAKNPEEQWDH